MDFYLDTRPIGWSKLTVIQCQFGFTSTRTSLSRPFGLCPFGRPCTVDLDTFKYTNTYCPFGQNLAVHMDALTQCIWTIQVNPNTWTYFLDDSWTYNLMVQIYVNCPIERSKYMVSDRLNGRHANGLSMLRQLWLSKWTTVQWTAYVTSIWTVQNYGCGRVFWTTQKYGCWP